jgi:hypothetical protein
MDALPLFKKLFLKLADNPQRPRNITASHAIDFQDRRFHAYISNGNFRSASSADRVDMRRVVIVGVDPDPQPSSFQNRRHGKY